MRTRSLGPLEVSLVGLGCNNFGRRIDEDATRGVVDAALDAGVTFFDTADVYGDGLSEEYLGRVLDGRRDRVVLATKFGGGGDGAGSGSRDAIRSAVDASLERLRTDRIDLYQHHQEDAETPLEETVAALDELVREGRSAPTARRTTRPSVSSARPRSRRSRTCPSRASTRGWTARRARALPACERLGLGFIPYFPLASGRLTGKYHRGERLPEGTRLAGRRSRASSSTAWSGSRRSRRSAAFAARRRDRRARSAAAIASVIAGATKPEQVRANAAAGAWEPSAEDVRALRAL
jgi:aryl-alcohol dehydrogenase-like predicted oxidoreductase